MSEGIFTIDKEVTEQMVIENCIMYKFAGYGFEALLFFYALGKSWNVDKVIYYNKLIGSIK